MMHLHYNLFLLESGTASSVYSSSTPWLAMTKRESCGRRPCCPCSRPYMPPTPPWPAPPCPPPNCPGPGSHARDGAKAVASRMGTSSAATEPPDEDDAENEPDFLRPTAVAEPIV